MAPKKESKKEKPVDQAITEITSAEDLKRFLTVIRDKMADDSSAPIYSAAVMNYLFNSPSTFSFFTSEVKEVAQEVWIKLKAKGLQVRNPPLLFGDEESQVQ